MKINLFKSYLFIAGALLITHIFAGRIVSRTAEQNPYIMTTGPRGSSLTNKVVSFIPQTTQSFESPLEMETSESEPRSLNGVINFFPVSSAGSLTNLK